MCNVGLHIYLPNTQLRFRTNTNGILHKRTRTSAGLWTYKQYSIFVITRWAIVASVKLWPDWFFIFHVKATHSFTRCVLWNPWAPCEMDPYNCMDSSHKSNTAQIKQLHPTDTVGCHYLFLPLIQTGPDRQVLKYHYNDVIMGAIPSQITSLTIVYSIVYSDANQRKHQSSASMAFVRWIHKWPVTRKMFPFDDVIMSFASGCRVGRNFQNTNRRTLIWLNINCDNVELLMWSNKFS